ncbi:MAG: OmpA family protein [Gemmatimonadaceae bacterium]
MRGSPVSSIMRARCGALAIPALLCGGCATIPAPATDHLTAVRDRVTDEAVAQDWRVLEAWTARADVLSRRGPWQPHAAAVAAAAAWLALARDAYGRNDRSALPDSALARAVALIEAVERGGAVPSLDVPLTLAGMSTRDRAVADETSALAHRDSIVSEIPEFGRLTPMLARASHPFLHAPACAAADTTSAAALLERVKDEAARRRRLSEQARQTPVPEPTPVERVPVVPQEPPTGMPPRCTELELPATVHFALDRSDLALTTRRVLDAVAAALISHADIHVTVVGHTDPRANDAYNAALSTRRATRVRDYLASQGIAAERITVEASGEGQPTAIGTTAREHAVNRRVEFRYEAASGCAVRLVDQLDDLQLERPRRPATP